MNHIKKYWHFALLLALALTPVVWFVGRGSVLINGLDTNFPLDPLVWFSRRFFVWNNIVNGGQDFNSSISGIFFHAIQTVPFVLGLSLQTVEIISLIFWFAAIVFSAYFFIVGIIQNSKVARVLFVLLYSLNTYLFNTWENVKVSNLALVVGIPLYLGILIRFRDKKMSYIKLFSFTVIASLICSGSGINPAYFITMLLITVIYFGVQVISMANLAEVLRFTKGYGLFLLAVFLANIFWILPLVNFLFFLGSVGTLADLGFTNWLDSLSQNTSLVNVIRLQGAWDWYALDTSGTPLYIPYAVNYFYRLPFIIFSFAVFVLSVLSLIFSQTKKHILYVFFATIALLGIFLASGSHTPTGDVYKFLVDKLPVFSFFRSPWYIFTPLIIVSMAALVSLFVEKLEEKSSEILKPAVYFIVAIFSLGHLLYSYPLITGKIFRPGRSDSFFVNFPSHVWETKDWLTKNSSIERIVSYPDDTLESFKWGYKGTESILGLLVDKEIFVPSFNKNNEAIELILKQFYTHVKKEEYQSALAVLKLLGADTIFDKRDASSLSLPINDDILAFTDNSKKIGDWRFYEISDDRTNPKIFAPKVIYQNAYGSSVLASVASLLETDAIEINSNDSEIAKVAGIKEIAKTIIEVKNETIDQKHLTDTVQKYTFEILTPGTYTLALEKNDLALSDIKLTMDGFDIPTGYTKESYLTWDITLSHAGKHTITIIYPESENIISSVDFSAYSAFEDSRSEELPINPEATLIAYNAEGREKRIVIPAARFNPFYRYLFEFDYKYFYGFSPFIETVQAVNSSPLRIDTMSMRATSDWDHHISLLDPVQIKGSYLNIQVVLPSKLTSERSKTFMENFSIKRIYDNKAFLLEQRDAVMKDPDVEFTKISPVKYHITVKNIQDNYILVFLENYNKGWKIKSLDGKTTNPTHFSINGYANAWYLPDTQSTQTYEIYYAPQKLFLVGLAVSTSTVLVAVGVLALNKFLRGRIAKNIHHE